MHYAIDYLWSALVAYLVMYAMVWYELIAGKESPATKREFLAIGWLVVAPHALVWPITAIRLIYHERNGYERQESEKAPSITPKTVEKDLATYTELGRAEGSHAALAGKVAKNDLQPDETGSQKRPTPRKRAIKSKATV